jgi:hypothetical protein
LGDLVVGGLVESRNIPYPYTSVGLNDERLPTIVPVDVMDCEDNPE